MRKYFKPELNIVVLYSEDSIAANVISSNTQLEEHFNSKKIKFNIYHM